MKEIIFGPKSIMHRQKFSKIKNSLSSFSLKNIFFLGLIKEMIEMIEYFLKFGSDRIKEKKFNVDRMWILKRY